MWVRGWQTFSVKGQTVNTAALQAPWSVWLFLSLPVLHSGRREQHGDRLLAESGSGQRLVGPMPGLDEGGEPLLLSKPVTGTAGFVVLLSLVSCV